MGATEFSCIALGKCASAAFKSAQDDARHAHGHEGYTGTVAEVSGFNLILLPPRVTINKALGWAESTACLDECESQLRDAEQCRRSGWKIPADRMKSLRAAVRQAKTRANKVPKNHRDLAQRIARNMSDKFGPCVCLCANAGETKRIKAERGRKGTHDHVYCFAGLASS